MRNTRLIDLPKEIFKIPWLETLLARLTHHKYPDQLIARFPPLYRSYPKNSIRKVERDGINYELDISDYMEWLVFYGILAEPRSPLYELVKSGDVVFDIGANIGEVTLNMARRVGSTGQVHSFEPEPFIFSKISRNLSLNSFTNIHLNNFALGNKEDTLFIKAPVEDNRGGTRIQSDSIGEKVHVSTLDTYVRDKAIAKLDVIKVDVEGFELKVLQGARETLWRFKPTLFIELNNNNLRDQGDSAAQLVDYLSNLGYCEIVHAESKIRISAASEFDNLHFDIIAL